MKNILLVDDHPLMRVGVKSILDQRDDIHIVGEAGDGRTALKITEEEKPDIVIMDISMPNLNGIEATRQICKQHPDTRIIVLTVHSSKQFVQKMLKAGAYGYLLKDALYTELEQAIDAVTKDEVFLSSKVARTVVNDYISDKSPESNPEFKNLTTREREVLQGLAEGKSAKEIASELYVSPKTIETHRKNIMDKLNIRNLADLIKYAIREGIIDVE